MAFKLEGVTAGYDRLMVLRDISLKVDSGEIVALVGSNGAGKTTLVKCVCRILKLKSGAIRFQDTDITKFTPSQVVSLGIACVPEGRKIFGTLTVLENLELGAFVPRAAKLRKASLKEVYRLLPSLESKRKQLAGTLSGGEQQMLAIGRALMSKPQILMLDEPSLGLAPMIVELIFETLKSLCKEGSTILLIEQDVMNSLEIADRAYVLEHGKIALEGPAKILLDSEEIKTAYLGI